MRKLDLQFRTLTPLWTGGVGRNSNEIRPTGLIGSLRWWHEGIIRGMGGAACDPNDKGCPLSLEEYNNAQSRQVGAKEAASTSLCPVCRLFGATGWRRRFRIEVQGLSAQPLFFSASEDVYQAAGNWLWRMFGGEDTGGARTGRGHKTEFAFGVKALWGEAATMNIVPFDYDGEADMARIVFLLDTAARYGGLGAKTQNGFGQIEYISALDQRLIAEGRKLIRQDAKQRPGHTTMPNGKSFNLARFFSRIYELPGPQKYINNLRNIGMPGEAYNRQYIPCAFDIRYKSSQRNPFTGQGGDFGMRPWFRQRWGDPATQELFGQSKARSDNERSAGRIRVSHLYRLRRDGPWYLKVWGWVPPSMNSAGKKQPELTEVVRDMDEFIMGTDGMFPSSVVVDQYRREEVLDK